MPINRRISSPAARFLKHPEKAAAFLERYSKENPAILSPDIYDAIKGNPYLAKYHDRIKVREKGDDPEPDWVIRGNPRPVKDIIDVPLTEAREIISEFVSCICDEVSEPSRALQEALQRAEVWMEKTSEASS
jgi:hypothetical protein